MTDILDLIAYTNVTKNVKDVIELMDCATLGVYKAGRGHTVKNVNNASSYFVSALLLVHEVFRTMS